MKKAVLILTAVFLVVGSGAAYAANVGHGPGIVVNPITPSVPPAAVLDKIVGAVPVAIPNPTSIPVFTAPAQEAIASTFGDSSSVVRFPSIVAEGLTTPGETVKIAF